MRARRRGLMQTAASRDEGCWRATLVVCAARCMRAMASPAADTARGRTARPHAVEEADDGRRPPAQFAERRAGALVQRLGQTMPLRQMVHEAEEDGRSARATRFS